MAVIRQQLINLNSQNQLRNADKLARDWAIAHAGAYQGQARKELGGSALSREWQRANLCIRISAPMSTTVKQGQIVGVRYRPAADAEPYTAYLMTGAYANTNADAPPSGGYCIAVIAMPEALDAGELPWDDKAGPSGLDAVLQTLRADRTRAAGTSGNPSGSRPVISAIADLFGQHDLSIVVTEDGQAEQELGALADRHQDWAAVSAITAAEQITIGRELPGHQLLDWLNAKIALFSRYADQDDSRLRLLATDGAQAAALLDAERQRIADDVANRNCLLLLEMLEGAADRQLNELMASARTAATRIAEEAAKPEPASAGDSPSPDNTAAQQRIYVLEDQMAEANSTIAELRERLSQYENYYGGAQSDAGDDAANAAADDGAEGAENRTALVMDSITNPERFSRLRFLNSCAKPLADFGKQRPTGAEIVAALDAINTLAQAWYNTPNGSIGNWDNYFINLMGWTHANDESDFTMSRYGDKRSFSDQDYSRKVTITRHLTYRGSNSGMQIYFDRDDASDKFIVGYIGEHLPYATNRS